MSSVSQAPEEPPGVRQLPLDRHGRRVPWFVAWVDGAPDFRVADEAKLLTAMRTGACWVCGGPPGVLGVRAYVVGPMCAVNRTSAEPPSHPACARYSALACPFLLRPTMRRRPGAKPDGTKPPAGEAILRNPGVTLVWTTRGGGPFRVGNGWLWDIGDPAGVEWWREGRPATRDEVQGSITSGLPILRDEAARSGAAALSELSQAVRAVQRLLPAA